MKNAKRKFPCRGKVLINLVNTATQQGYVKAGTIVTVLEDQRTFTCCSDKEVRYPIECDGLPDPPEQCMAWLVRPQHIELIQD